MNIRLLSPDAVVRVRKLLERRWGVRDDAPRQP